MKARMLSMKARKASMKAFKVPMKARSFLAVIALSFAIALFFHLKFDISHFKSSSAFAAARDEIELKTMPHPAISQDTPTAEQEAQERDGKSQVGASDLRNAQASNAGSQIAANDEQEMNEGGATSQSTASTGRSATGRTPVLVELFTSEGCSSCPPADALLARFVQTQPVPGAEIIALKEHVDYWNRLGWKDRFSSRVFTARQESYSEFFGNNSVYTPQMVVDGRTEFVGSDEAQAIRAITTAARAPKIWLKLERTEASSSAQEILLEISAAPHSSQSLADGTEMFLAVTEDALHSDIRSGENAGLSVDHFAVVRTLAKISSEASTRSQEKVDRSAFPKKVKVTLEDGWNREHLKTIVFVQDSKSRRVVAVGSLRL